ncbi:MAG: M55 family metallopeptidase [Candidatus Ratteibacteria bacterium]
MKIYLMTDLEGVAGVLNSENWCRPESSRYYELAKKFLTNEVNAAVDGFFSEGANEVLVVDGHGPGGIDVELLDPRTSLLRGWGPGPYPMELDSGIDFVGFVGQHAKAGTPYAHLAHSQSFVVKDLSINGLSVGEFGQVVLCASELGIRTIFAAGDEAFTREAEELLPGIESVAVKRGLNPDPGEHCTAEQYKQHNTGAIHLHPKEACARIRDGAKRALAKAKKEKNFGIEQLMPPFEKITIYRPVGEAPGRVVKVSHPSSVIAVMNLF